MKLVIEKIKEKTFTFDTKRFILMEAPHIVVGDKAIDFEFEVDKLAGLKNIIKAIMKEEITDKHGSKFKLTSDKEVNEFIAKIKKNSQIKRTLK